MYFCCFILFFLFCVFLKNKKLNDVLWWLFLVDYCESYLMLGEKGDKIILFILLKKGYIFDKIGLKWEFRVCRMNFD